MKAIRIHFTLFILIFCVDLSSSQSPTFVNNYSVLLTTLEGKNLVEFDDGSVLMGDFGTLLYIDSVGALKLGMDLLGIGLPFNNTFSIYSIVPVNPNKFVFTGNKSFIVSDSSFNLSVINRITTINGGTVSIYDSFLNNDSTITTSGLLDGANGNSYPFHAIIDTSGNILTYKSYASNGPIDYQNQMVKTTDGGALMAYTRGIFNNPPALDAEVILIKVDSMGNLLWSKLITSPTGRLYALSLKTITNGGYILSGENGLHKYLLKIDDFGNVVWSKSYEFGIGGSMISVNVTSDGGFVATGFSNISSNFEPDIYKLDSLGNVLWAKSIAPNSGIIGIYIKESKDGGFLIRGPGSANNLIVIKTDSSGEVNNCTGVLLNPNVTNLSLNAQSIFVYDTIIPINSTLENPNFPISGQMIEICGPQGDQQINTSLIDIYPSPTSHILLIKFPVVYKRIDLIIRDMNGRIVETIYDIKDNQFSIDVENYKCGLYSIQILQPNGSVIERFIKM